MKNSKSIYRDKVNSGQDSNVVSIAPPNLKVPIPAEVTDNPNTLINHPKTPLKIKIGTPNSFVPAGEYLTKVVDLRLEKSPFKNKITDQNKPIFIFKFTIVTGPHSGVIVRGFCNADYLTFTPNTKLFRWLSVVNGENPEEGEELDLGVFFEKVLRVRVEEKVSRKTKIPFGNVTEILGVHDEF